MLCLLLYHLLSRVFTLIEVIPESLEDGALCGGVAFEVVAVFHLLQLFLLVAAQCLWHIDADIHYHVALTIAISLHLGQTFRSQS